MSRPTVGRAVHYVARGSADGFFPAVCRSAEITEVDDMGRVGLCVTNPTGLFFHPLAMDGGVPYHPGDTDVPADAAGARCNIGRAVYPGGSWHFAELI